MGFAATLVYLLFVFVRPQELNPAWAGYRVMDLLGGVAIASTLLSLAMGHRPRFRGLELPLGVAFLLWSAFSVAAAIHWFGGAAATLYGLSVSFATVLLVAFNVSTRRHLGLAIGVAVASLLAILLVAIHAYYSAAEESPFFLTTTARGALDTMIESPEEATTAVSEDADASASTRLLVRRIRGLGFLADPNDLAQALASSIPLVFLLWRRRRPFRNAIAVLVPVGILVWGILLTRSRGALIALVALTAAALVSRLRPRLRRLASTAAVVLAGPAFIVLFGYAKADASAQTRLEAWSAGLLMLKSSPIWGVGSGLFTEHHERVAHNSYVQCFAETGLVGYFLWLGLLVVTLTRLSALADSATHPAWARWAKALRLSVMAFLFAAAFLSRTTSPMLFFLLSLPIALTGIAGREGESVPAPRRWWLRTLALEFFSIIVVWVTSRAFYA